MARQSVIPEIREKLEAYLDQCEAAYQAQSITERTPTLPYTPDFKVNVSAVGKAIGLRDTQRKYLHEREELRTLIDMVAEGQGLLPVGGRLLDVADQVIRDRLAQQAAKAKDDAQAAAKANGRVAALIDELSAAHARIAELEAEVMRHRMREELLQVGIMVRTNE